MAIVELQFGISCGEAGKPGMVGTGTGTGTGMCDRKSHTPQAKYNSIAH